MLYNDMKPDFWYFEILLFFQKFVFLAGRLGVSLSGLETGVTMATNAPRSAVVRLGEGCRGHVYNLLRSHRSLD